MYEETIKHDKKGKNFQLRVFGAKHPEFRFSCPKCGSLEVYVTWKTNIPLKGHCLECKNDWSLE